MSLNKAKVEISVVIPVYNRSKLLKKTLISLENQTLSKELFEVIVIDDGSKENISSVCENIRKNSSLQLRDYRQENQGPGTARNLGAKKAKSKLIALIDSDVLADKNWLQNALAIFQEKPNLGAIEGKTIVPEKEKITPFTHQTENLHGGKYPTCNFILQKKLCHFYPGYTYAFREDSDLAFSILQQGFAIEFHENVLAFHPPLPAKLVTPFRLASRYQYDYLLKKRFPSYYKKILDVHKIAFFSIAHLRKKIYSSFLLALLAWFLLWIRIQLSSSNPPSQFIQFSYYISSFAVVLSYLANLTVHIKTINIKSTGFFGLLWLSFISILLPFIAIYSLFKGMYIFRKAKPYKH